WFLLIPCAAVSADYLLPDYPASPVSGSGGTTGAWLRGWLESSFDPSGCLAILGGCLALGLVLALDFILVRLVRLLWKSVRWLVRSPERSGRWFAPRPRLGGML